jgi:signal transduction histidine kinase
MGIGLENIKRRTLLFSGDLVIDSGPGKGCRLIIKLPLKSNNSVLTE